MPAHHDVRPSDVFLRRLRATLVAAASRAPADFAELLLTPGVGARTVFALALVSEVVHGAPYRFADPARFSFAHGGKDGYPFSVPLRVYDETIHIIRRAIEHAKLGSDDKLFAVRRLDEQARRIERATTGPRAAGPRASGPSFEQVVTHEAARSDPYGGRPVSDAGPRGRQGRQRNEGRPRQLSLF
jgi:hypothetical protein